MATATACERDAEAKELGVRSFVRLFQGHTRCRLRLSQKCSDSTWHMKRTSPNISHRFVAARCVRHLLPRAVKLPVAVLTSHSHAQLGQGPCLRGISSLPAVSHRWVKERERERSDRIRRDKARDTSTVAMIYKGQGARYLDGGILLSAVPFDSVARHR